MFVHYTTMQIYFVKQEKERVIKGGLHFIKKVYFE